MFFVVSGLLQISYPLHNAKIAYFVTTCFDFMGCLVSLTGLMFSVINVRSLLRCDYVWILFFKPAF